MLGVAADSPLVTQHYLSKFTLHNKAATPASQYFNTSHADYLGLGSAYSNPGQSLLRCETYRYF